MDKEIYYAQAKASGISQGVTEKILCHILGCTKEHLFLLSDIAAEHLYEFQKYLYEFQKGLPEAFIFGEQEFFGRNFLCNTSTLIPRKETELLVDVLKNLCLRNADMDKSSYIDIGTGTTCILTSLYLELLPLKFSYIYGVDIHDDILNLGRENITKYQLQDVELIKSSILQTFLDSQKKLTKNVYISANLPYIKNGDIDNMGDDVVKYEPKSALYGGSETGFELYESLVKECFLLKKIYRLHSIHLCIEIGYDQFEYSQTILSELGLQFEYFKDIHSIQRVIYITGF